MLAILAAAMRALTELRTTEDAGRSLPSYGPAWDAAIAAGIDVTMLEQNLQLTPAERIQQLDEANLFLEEVQARTLPERARQERDNHRLMEKLAALGLDLEAE
jgi:hypothetical protein